MLHKKSVHLLLRCSAEGPFRAHSLVPHDALAKHTLRRCSGELLRAHSSQSAASARIVPVVVVPSPVPASAPSSAQPPAPAHLAPEHTRPDWIEAWGRKSFFRFGAGLSVAAGAAVATCDVVTAAAVAAPVALYWAVGLRDLAQTRHTILRNFPVLGHARWMAETLRPEIRQYFLESDTDSVPFTRLERNIVYQRAKGVPDTQSFGTRANVYEPSYEWCLHSMSPKHLNPEDARVLIGGPHCAPEHVYSSSIYNVSGMSYGALSENAVLALNSAAKMGNFSHNTGEGGISRFHLQHGGDIVWNIGSGYFGCRGKDGRFDAGAFVENALRPSVKMIEVKLSQGAKPAHGGVLPAAKVTAAIAEARGVPVGEDCVSPLRHSEFSGPHELLLFVQRLRELSGGKPVGIKFCVGIPGEVAALVHAMKELDLTPDFITVDGAEGGTGAAPKEFSDWVGSPLSEGLVLVDGMLQGAGLRSRVKLIAAGKIVTGKGICKTLALGADVTNAARAMLFALGCVQALKCSAFPSALTKRTPILTSDTSLSLFLDTGFCPTGVTSQVPELVAGLVPEDKAHRVARYHKSTVAAAVELMGAMGMAHPADRVDRSYLMRRVSHTQALSYEDLYPTVRSRALLEGSAKAELQRAWDATVRQSDAAAADKLHKH